MLEAIAAMVNTLEEELNVVRPTLLLDKARAMRNIENMSRKANKSGVRFRPHFKTHQSAEIGEWFRPSGVRCITVSSVDMAFYFAEHGWKDVTIAFPTNIREIKSINKLAERINLSLLVESTETVDFLAKNIRSNVNLWIDIDVGYKRTGIQWNNTDEVVKLAERIKGSKSLLFTGILTHAGHSYEAKSAEAIRKIHLDSVTKMNKLRDDLQEQDFSNVEISVGDTPTCSIADDFSKVDEIRPGTFVLCDVRQLNLGSCHETDIAIALACPIVAKHLDRKEIVIYGGAAHLSKDFILDKSGTKIFGYVCQLGKTKWEPRVRHAYVSSLSQEHGIVKTDSDFLSKIRVGDMLMILPVHSCLTVDLMREFLTLEGNRLQTMPKFH